jgi:hypothetical protein
MKRFMMGSILGVCMLSANGAHAIPTSYGEATHSTEKWQQLGTHEADTDGVFWSTDGGLNWGQEAVNAGDDISFKFLMHKKQNGTHYADYIKAWVDWDQDGAFDDIAGSDSDDVIMFDKRNVDVKNESHTDHLDGTDYTAEFFSGTYHIDESFMGELWLRARVVCSADLGMRWPDGDGIYPETPSFDYDEAFNPTGHYGQGEVEEHGISVTSVPAPPATLLLGLGLLGLAISRKRVA